MFIDTESDMQNELLTFAEIAAQYKIKEPTQRSWYASNAFGWRSITYKVGARLMVRRADLEAWLESRKGLVQEPRRTKATTAQTGA
ncbi:MAG: helix-turn-helix domain-containing protein [Pseudomonadota bacterium]